jgi:pimeloyl-ACP methyl ester carboxylesterase
MPALVRAGYRVIAPDLRGYGGALHVEIQLTHSLKAPGFE